jgi:hypothetical protein
LRRNWKARHPHAKENYDVQLQAQGGTLIVINSGGHTMPNLRLVILLILAFLLTAAITHLQAQQYGPEPEGMCPEPTTDYGAAMGFFISAGATPGGESRKLANKTCYNQDLELSDQKTYSSSSPASNATTTYSYDVGRGRLKLQAEVKASGHKTPVPISGGTYNANGRGGGNVYAWLQWVDTLTLHSATTKPAPKVKGAVIDPAQVVEISLKLLHNGQNVCSGGGGNYNFYKTSVSLVGDTGSDRQVMFEETTWQYSSQIDPCRVTAVSTNAFTNDSLQPFNCKENR